MEKTLKTWARRRSIRQVFLGKTDVLLQGTKMSFIEKAKKKLGDFAGAAKDAVNGDDKKSEEAGDTSSSTIDKVKSKQGILSKIQDILTLGYSTKEDLREVDKKLRDLYYAEFKGMRHKWEEIYLAALNAKQRNGADYKKVIQVMDRVAEKINRADYGYAGLMDRKGHVRENELARVFDYDKAFGTQIQGLDQSIDDLYSFVESENWIETPPRIRSIKNTLLDIEGKWDGREKEFRPLEA